MCKQRIERRRGIAAGVAGLDGQEVGQQAQCVLPAFAGLEDLLHPIGTEDHPHPVMVARRGKREQRGQFMHRIPFRAARPQRSGRKPKHRRSARRPVRAPRCSV